MCFETVNSIAKGSKNQMMRENFISLMAMSANFFFPESRQRWRYQCGIRVLQTFHRKKLQPEILEMLRENTSF